MQVHIELNTRDVVVATWGRVAIGLWRGHTTAADVRTCTELVRSWEAAAEPLLLLTVIEKHAPVPSLDARMELIAFLKACNGQVARHALVFEGDGFREATVRAVVSALLMFSRPTYPYRVFASIGAAARFLAGGKQGALAPHLVIRLLRDVRRRPADTRLAD